MESAQTEMTQHLLRFVIGGFFVSLFSVLGESFKPKTFAGIFGAAPSIAIAAFILIWSENGVSVVETQSRSMIFGAMALIVACASCAKAIRKTDMSLWIGTGFLWIEWFLVALGLYRIFLK